ncbi:MAG: hypothetical protein SCALA702_07280 [Melioribacteraceae bacterium]|nr:MAG: hypothetical protein SCALA702_07280 [Melioribacteraceae bacterium]
MFGGRWNRKGTPVIYTGESIEIALLEILVHLPVSITPLLDLVTLEIPPKSVKSLQINELPDNWRNYPAPTVLSEIGDSWIKEGSKLALKVPSTIISSAFNYIINCRHREFDSVKIISINPFEIDSRLMKHS